jgi:hypothetical protein
LSIPDGGNFLARPVLNGLCKYESLIDGTLGLDDLAEMNEWLDVRDENDARAEEAHRQHR